MDESTAKPQRVFISTDDYASLRANREVAWRALLGRIRENDQDALAALYDQSSALVFGVAQRILGSREDAEEIALDVYKQIWRGAQTYDDSRGAVMSWLVMLTRSRALDRIRSRASRERVEHAWDSEPGTEPSAPSFEERSLLALDSSRVTKALASLPAEQREAIEMAFFEGLSHSELAQRLDIPLGTIKTRIRQGIMKLRQALGGLN